MYWLLEKEGPTKAVVSPMRSTLLSSDELARFTLAIGLHRKLCFFLW